MIRKKREAIEWLEFELFGEHPELVHAVFLRHGGASHGPFHSLNVADHTGDNPEHVEENLSRVRSILNLEKLVTSHQVHGAEIKKVEDIPKKLPQCDGLMTNEPNLGLMVMHADCQAALFYDPIHQAFAAIHAGWRGNVQNIYQKTVEKMQRAFHSKPEDLLVGISPSLGPDHAEFKNYAEELPEAFWPFQTKPAHFDLWEIARSQLEESGILPHHIEIASICTFAAHDDYFSYRREQLTGRHGTVAFLRKF
ncbi:MAG: peptidoglycan editing factor PgeF [Verrucomicrobia bacterium]|nr:peptidoglycan editing factor PgeF [Verrucomicrobiota bacterium]